jgi:hypothetical protein
MRLLLVLAVALLPIGVLSGWAGVGMLRDRTVPRQPGALVVCVLCLAVAALATTGAVATMAMAALAFA